MIGWWWAHKSASYASIRPDWWEDGAVTGSPILVSVARRRGQFEDMPCHCPIRPDPIY
jgi:hypothetical protein